MFDENLKWEKQDPDDTDVTLQIRCIVSICSGPNRTDWTSADVRRRKTGMGEMIYKRKETTRWDHATFWEDDCLVARRGKWSTYWHSCRITRELTGALGSGGGEETKRYNCGKWDCSNMNEKLSRKGERSVAPRLTSQEKTGSWMECVDLTVR